MALFKNQYLADAVLNLLKGTAITTPSSIKMALLTTLPTRTDTNATIVRTTYPSYADETITSGQWLAIVESNTTGSSITTNSNIVFTSPSGTPSPISNIIGFAILDNSNNILYQGALSIPLVVSVSGQLVEVPSGALTITEA